MSRGSNERKCIFVCDFRWLCEKTEGCVFCVCMGVGIVKDRLRCPGSDESLAKESRVESVETKRWCVNAMQ